jgi:hypothetical protein
MIRKPELKIITRLWSGPASVKELEELLNLAYEKTEKYCRNLCVNLNFIHFDFENEIWKLNERYNSITLDDLLILVKKKLAYQKLENSYKHYEGNVHGSRTQWKKAAEKLLGEKTVNNKYLNIFGLNKMPTMAELKRIYRKLVKIYHPDKGGSNEKIVELSEAFEKLKFEIVFKNS